MVKEYFERQGAYESWITLVLTEQITGCDEARGNRGERKLPPPTLSRRRSMSIRAAAARWG